MVVLAWPGRQSGPQLYFVSWQESGRGSKNQTWPDVNTPQIHGSFGMNLTRTIGNYFFLSPLPLDPQLLDVCPNNLPAYSSSAVAKWNTNFIKAFCSQYRENYAQIAGGTAQVSLIFERPPGCAAEPVPTGHKPARQGTSGTVQFIRRKSRRI
jgi:hypothetical protein